MGWLELNAWLTAMKTQREGSKPKVDSWAVEDPWFAEQRRKREEERRQAW